MFCSNKYVKWCPKFINIYFLFLSMKMLVNIWFQLLALIDFNSETIYWNQNFFIIIILYSWKKKFPIKFYEFNDII